MAGTKKPSRDEQEAAAPTSKHQKQQLTAHSQVDTSTRDGSIFPFFQLPAEIRNIIYEYALVDTKFVIHFEASVSEHNRKRIVRRLYHSGSRDPDRDDIAKRPHACVTNPAKLWTLKPYPCATQHVFHIRMLEACRQMNYEAAPIFYGQNLFVFGTVSDLRDCLKHFYNRIPYLRKIGLTSTWNLEKLYGDYWNQLRTATTSKTLQKILFMELDTVLARLVGAVQLEAIYLSADVLQSLSNRADRAAHRFYGQAEVWLRAQIFNKKDPLAVIKLPKVAIKKRRNRKWYTSRSGQDEFLASLAKLLSKKERK